MKEAWVQLEEWSKDLATTPLESGAAALVFTPGYAQSARGSWAAQRDRRGRRSDAGKGRVLPGAQDGEGRAEEGTLFLQNAETVCLVTSEGEARSVAAPVPGDAVLVSMEAGARRFGRSVEETIWEK